MRFSLFLIIVFSWQAYAEDGLPETISNVLQHRNLPEDSLSIYVESLDTGEPVLAWNEAKPRNPASVMKILTTLVALDVLGPTYRWETNLYLLGDVDQGELKGDLLIQGSGDPFLVTDRFWQMLRKVRQAGIQRIDGDLLLDDSYFSVPYYDAGAFDREPLRAYNVGPNALLSNLKVVRYVFEPDPVTGGVTIRVDPALGDLQVQNRLRVRPGSCRGYQRGIAISMNDELNKVTFSGDFPDGCDIYSMDRTALSHNQYTYSLFKSVWNESGGELTGEWRNVVTPLELEPDITFRSMPLSDVISKINKHSNNVMARQLLLTLGAEVNGAPGTSESGREVVIDWLSQHGLGTSEMKLENGAGLSRDVRLTTKMLVDLLRLGFESPFMPEYVSSLSLSGLDGTLSRRFRDGSLTGKAHMKTGSLDHVTAIAGYFQAASGRRYLVAAMQNYTDIHRGPGEEVQAALLSWLDGQ
jgi:D-alanyl-D-alanine carboxypeptidase/D-alanyl-D-alanine-endopeptidase (penicillin-binding protein 4)